MTFVDSSCIAIHVFDRNGVDRQRLWRSVDVRSDARSSYPIVSGHGSGHVLLRPKSIACPYTEDRAVSLE